MKRCLVVAFACSFVALALPAQESRPAPAGAPAVAELEALLAKAKQAVAAGADGQALLADKQFVPLREEHPFRELVAKHAPKGELTIGPAGEPGTPLVVRGTVRDQHGKPVSDALVYAYHADQNGKYADRWPRLGGGRADGEPSHARLFAYVRTDAKGEFVLRTIRPGGYPQTTIPEHVHWYVSVGGKEIATGEVLFDDDKRLTKEARVDAGKGTVICKVEQEGKAQLVRPVFDVRLPEPATKKGD